jgi:hypothetical protein
VNCYKDWKKVIDFAYDEVTYWGTWGQHVNVDEAIGWNPETQPSQYIVQWKERISCHAAERVLEQAYMDKEDPPDYNLIQDCHWYARRLMNLGLTLGAECK